MSPVLVRLAAVSLLVMPAAGLAALTTFLPPPSVGPSAEPTLHIGDAAPEFTVETWVRGEGPKAVQKGKPHVVVFWSSWSKPTGRAVLPVSELAAKHREKVGVIAIHVAEPRGLSAVQAFVGQNQTHLTFPVGYDHNGRTDRAWVWASGWAEKELPTFFVVDADGKLAWIGSSLAALQSVVDRVLDGTFDAKKQAEEEAAAEARRVAAAEKAGQLRALVQQAMAKGDTAAALKHIDELVALDPESAAEFAMMRFELLVQSGQGAKAAEYAAQAVRGPLKDDAIALNDFAWGLLTEEGMPKEALPVALEAAKRASDLTKNEDAMILDTLAKAYFDTGDKAKALETQRRAVALIPADWDEEARAELNERLRQYEAAK